MPVLGSALHTQGFAGKPGCTLGYSPPTLRGENREQLPPPLVGPLLSTGCLNAKCELMTYSCTESREVC